MYESKRQYQYGTGRRKSSVARVRVYQGGTGSLVSMGALRNGLTEEELPDIVERWRRANPNIVNFWYTVDAAAREAVNTGRMVELWDGRIAFASESDPRNGLDFLTIRLPSGRKLYYAKPYMGVNKFGQPSLGYWGMNQKTKRWEQLETYGGKLVENITQATARDCLRDAMAALDKAGYRIVFHVHDEVIADMPQSEGSLKDMQEIMGRPLPWAPGLPLRAAGFEASFYMKD